MKRLRWNVLALLVWLVLFFNIERLDLGSSNTINLAPPVYLVGLCAVIIPMVSPFRQRGVWLSMLAALSLLIVGLLVHPAAEFGGYNTYLTIVEVVMVVVTTLLAYRVNSFLEEFRQAVEMITLADKSSRLHTLASAQERVQIEMSGSRRTQRPLSLVLLQADATSLNTMMHRFVAELQQSMMQRYVLSMAARVLSRSLRRTDLIIEDQTPGRLVLVAPETSEPNAQVLGERLVRLLQQRLGVTARVGVASFPERALTFEDLMSRAEERLQTVADPGLVPLERTRAVGEAPVAVEVLAFSDIAQTDAAQTD